MRVKRGHRRAPPEFSSPAPQAGSLTGPPTATSIQPPLASAAGTPLTSTTGYPATPFNIQQQPKSPPRLHPDSNFLPVPPPHFDAHDPKTFPDLAPVKARELFKLHMLNNVMPTFPEEYGQLNTRESRVARAYEIYDEELPLRDRIAWEDLYSDLESRWQRAESEREWRKVSRRDHPTRHAQNQQQSSARTDADGDVGMHGAEH